MVVTAEVRERLFTELMDSIPFTAEDVVRFGEVAKHIQPRLDAMVARIDEVLREVPSLRVAFAGDANTLDASAFTLGPVTLSGGGGDDTFSGGTGNDQITGGGGTDVLVESADTNFTLGDWVIGD